MKKHSGIFSFDASLAFLITAVMLSQFIIISDGIASANQKQRNAQALFDALFSISEIVVSYDGAEKEEGLGFGSKKVRPNAIDKEELGKIDVEGLKKRFGLAELSIGFREGRGSCIYRLVLYEGEIKKLFFCGGYAEH